jgi:flagellar biosynthesis GTPase FlhF
MLTKDFNLQRAGASAPADPKKENDPQDNKRKAAPQWILDDMAPDRVKIEKNWKELLADNDKNIQASWLKGRIAVGLQSLYEVLPTYTDKDLVVCNRQNDKGGWKTELWTARPFAAEELIFAPLSSALKDSHLTDLKNAVVGIPKYGCGKHPQDQALALDGRGRYTIAHAGSLDGTEYTGSLFWLVSRTSAMERANMSLENVSWEHTVKVSLPLKSGKKRAVEWASKDLPTIPVLMNKQKIEAHMRLAVFHDEEKDKKAKEKAKEDKAKDLKAKVDNEAKAKDEEAREKAKEEAKEKGNQKKEEAKTEKAKEEAKQKKEAAKEEKAKQLKKEEAKRKEEAKTEKAKEEAKQKKEAAKEEAKQLKKEEAQAKAKHKKEEATEEAQAEK